jgi:putative tricarboxylic transport membrane protein
MRLEARTTQRLIRITGPMASNRIRLPEALVGAGVLVLAAVMLGQIRAIPASPVYSQVGPTIFPYIAFGGLVVLGALLVLQALRGGWQEQDEREALLDWQALGWLALGLALNVALIGLAGFIIASTLMFICIARAFGSRSLLRDAAIGFALAAAAYFGFAKALGVSLGQGYLERLLGG